MPPKGSLRRFDTTVRQLAVLPGLPVGGRYPCDTCPMNRPDVQKVPPAVPEKPILGVVGLGSGLEEQHVLSPFVGKGGAFLRSELNKVGLPAGTVDNPHDPAIRLTFANLTRCRPAHGNFRSPEFFEGADRCWAFLENDLAGSYPLLALGSEPLKRLLQDKSANVSRMRGMWYRAPNGRQVFSTWHPAGIAREIDEVGPNAKKVRQFRDDLKRMADRVLGREKLPEVQVDIFRSPSEAEDFLRGLSRHKRPWAFDIESYDHEQPDSARENVATDPFHPMFRVRGVAIAWQHNRGAWIELMSAEGMQEFASRILGPAFASPAEKWAFNGPFDENGLVYQKWVPRIANRKGDGMLGLVAINAGGQEGFSLERAVVSILGEPQFWTLNKLKIGSANIQNVAEASVRDACSTLKLTAYLHAKLEAEEYTIPDDDED